MPLNRWFKLLAVISVLLVAAPSAFAAASQHSVSDVHALPGGAVVPGAWSQLVRNDTGVAMTLHTSQLTPGTATTVWWIIFNHPENCTGGCGADDLGNPLVQASVLYATGHVIGGDGVGDFGARLAVADTTGALLGPGLLNPLGADIQLVVRSHGPAIPGLIDQQIHSFNGGCPPNTCTNVQGSMHQP
jgi:hypothetical protein